MENQFTKQLFEQFISAYWKDVASFCPYMGAFLIDHNSKDVFMDDNCKHLLSVTGDNAYTSILDRLNGVECQLITDIEVKKIVDGPLIVLGVVKPKNLSVVGSKHNYNPSLLSRFRQLVDNNLFQYHFQPIIDAHSGDIIAYEALMRTDSNIALSPIDILDVAQHVGELYSIEKATMTNTMKYVSENKEMFKNKLLFVNAISSCILKAEDWSMLEEQYGDIIPSIVIELTEQTEIRDEEIADIHERIKRNKMRLAIDDYGTGYSNTSNLLRYKPDFVKLDRALISEIDTKPNMQKLVGSLIEFMHANGMTTLAEGVETLDEITTVIRLGVDLIQGYYVSKPKPFIMHEVAESTRSEINTINIQYSSDIAKIYHTVENDVIDLHKLANERYGTIYVESENVTVNGIANEYTNIQFIIADELETHMKWKNVCIKSDKDDALVSLGNSSILHLEVEGFNDIIGKGIYVPSTTLFELTGFGTLKIFAEKTTCYGIGVDKGHSHGNIHINLYGDLILETNGDDVVSIGGGKNAYGNDITFSSGGITIRASGNNCLAIGSLEGNSIIDISNCEFNIEMSSSNCTAIGALTGSASISLKNYHVQTTLMGLNSCGIGVLRGGTGDLIIRNGKYDALLKGREIIAIGTNDGNIHTSLRDNKITVRCEGSHAVAIGDLQENGRVSISRCDLNLSVSSSDGYGIRATADDIKIVDTSTDKIFINND